MKASVSVVSDALPSVEPIDTSRPGVIALTPVQPWVVTLEQRADNTVQTGVSFSSLATPSIRSLRCGNTDWLCGVTDVLRIRLHNVAAQTSQWYGLSDMTDVALAAPGIITAKLSVGDGDINVTATFAVSGQKVTATITVVNASASRSLDAIDFPRVAVLPLTSPQNCYAVNPIWGGYVERTPHLLVTEAAFSAPSGMGFWGYNDAGARKCLYFEKRDDSGRLAEMVSIGSGDSTIFALRQYPANSRDVGNDYTQTMALSFDTLDVLGDARSAHHDCVERYRSWALEQVSGVYQRPWLAGRSKWSTGYPARVAGLKCIIAHADAAVQNTADPPNYAWQLLDLQRTIAFLGSPGTDVMEIAYFAHANIFDVTQPSQTPFRSGWNAHVDAVQVGIGAHVVPYVIARYWNSDLVSGVWNITNYSTFGDIRQYMVQDRLGALSLSTNKNGQLVWAGFSFEEHATVASIWADMVGKWRSESTSPCRGAYFDQVGGAVAPLAFNFKPSLGTRGNNAAQGTNMGQTVDAMIATVAASDSGFIHITEAESESTLGFHMTLTAHALGRSLGFGVHADLFAAVYGQFQRSFGFNVQIADPADSSQALLYAQQMIASWLHGHPLGYFLGTTPAAAGHPFIDHASAPSAPLHYTAQVMKVLYDAHARAIPWFQGRLMRPLRDAWQYRAIDSSETISIFLAAQETFMSSVWRKDDGSLGIIVVNHNTTDQFHLLVHVRDYGLPEFTTKTLTRDVGAGPVFLATVTDRVDLLDAAPLSAVTIYALT